MLLGEARLAVLAICPNAARSAGAASLLRTKAFVAAEQCMHPTYIYYLIWIY